MKKFYSLNFLLIFLIATCSVVCGEEIDSRRFGNTGKKLGVISINTASSELNSESFHLLTSSGANFIDTSPFIPESEIFVAQNLGPSLRKDCLLSTRWKPNYAHDPSSYVDLFQKSIQRLNTNFIDCVIIDGVSELSDIQTTGVLSAFSRLKKENKTKYLGVYVRDEKRDDFAKIIRYILMSGNFDFVVLDYNALTFTSMQSVAEVIGRQGLGVIAYGAFEEGERNPSLARRIAGRKKLDLDTAIMQWSISSSKWITSVLAVPSDTDKIKNITKGAIVED